MEAYASLFVLASAITSAFWHLIVKGQNTDKEINIALSLIGSSILVIPFLFFIPPPSLEGFIYMGLSMCLYSLSYYLVARSYNYGDLSQVMPLGKGATPLLVLVLSFFIVGEHVEATDFFGIFAISVGIIILASLRGQDRRGVNAALMGAIITALFTLTDGLGTRANTHPLSYAVYLFLIDGFVFPSIVYMRKGKALPQAIRKHWRVGMLSGLLALFTYGTFVWSLNYLDLGVASALRSTNILFGSFLGMILLREGLTKRRVSAAVLITAGIIILEML